MLKFEEKFGLNPNEMSNILGGSVDSIPAEEGGIFKCLFGCETCKTCSTGGCSTCASCSSCSSASCKSCSSVSNVSVPLPLPKETELTHA